VEAGVSWDKLSGLSQDLSITIPGSVSTNSSSKAAELQDGTSRGFVIGAGLDIKLLMIHIAPQVRYTRWGDKHFSDPLGLLTSNQNQGEFLLGIKF
jgi:hypothetical protein